MHAHVQKGACQRPDVELNLWSTKSKPRRLRAKQLCSLCPLLEACRQTAIYSMPPTHGQSYVVAGMTENELYRERKRLGVRVSTVGLMPGPAACKPSRP